MPDAASRRNGRGNRVELVPKIRDEHIAIVTTEEFVATIAREADGDALTRKPCDEKGRNLRNVRERFVIDIRQRRNDSQRVRFGHVKFGMVCPKVRSNIGCVIGLVIGDVVKPDGKGFDGSLAPGLHESGDRTGINSAGEERTERHIGNHVLRNDIA